MRASPESVVASATYIALALAVPLTTHGADTMYHFKDGLGVDHFSNVPADPRYKLLPLDLRYQTQSGTHTSPRGGGVADVPAHAALPQQPYQDDHATIDPSPDGSMDVPVHAALPQQPYQGDPAPIDRDVHPSGIDMPLPAGSGEDAADGNIHGMDESMTEVAVPDRGDAENRESTSFSDVPAFQGQSLIPMQQQ